MNSKVAHKLRKKGYEFVVTPPDSQSDHILIANALRSMDTGQGLAPNLPHRGLGKDEKEFFPWFFEDVLGLSSPDYRRRFYHAATAYGHTIGEKPITFSEWQHMRGVRPGERIGDAILVAVVLGSASLLFYLVRKSIRRHLATLRRPTYYEQERLRRIFMRKTRHMILPRATHNRKPTMDEIRRAWNGTRHTPEGALRLGGMLEDLECFVNNHALGNEFVGYCGRYGGIKRLLEKEAPDLFRHYKALMHYKSIARRYRQTCGESDPTPTDALLPVANETTDKSSIPKAENSLPLLSAEKNPPADKRGQRTKTSESTRNTSDNTCHKASATRFVSGMEFPCREYEVPTSALETAVRILQSCENSVISLEAALALELEPDCTDLAPERFGPTKSRDANHADCVHDVVKRRAWRRVSDRVACWIGKRNGTAA